MKVSDFAWKMKYSSLQVLNPDDIKSMAYVIRDSKALQNAPTTRIVHADSVEEAAEIYKKSGLCPSGLVTVADFAETGVAVEKASVTVESTDAVVSEAVEEKSTEAVVDNAQGTEEVVAEAQAGSEEVVTEKVDEVIETSTDDSTSLTKDEIEALLSEDEPTEEDAETVVEEQPDAGETFVDEDTTETENTTEDAAEPVEVPTEESTEEASEVVEETVLETETPTEAEAEVAYEEAAEDTVVETTEEAATEEVAEEPEPENVTVRVRAVATGELAWSVNVPPSVAEWMIWAMNPANGTLLKSEPGQPAVFVEKI